MSEQDIEETCGVIGRGQVRHLRWPQSDGLMACVALCCISPLTPLLAGDSKWRYPLCKKCERSQRNMLRAPQPKEEA